MSIIDAQVDQLSFLVRFDRAERITTVTTFDDPVAAESAYDLAERELGRDGSVEVVLITADDLDTVKVTHASYFTGQDVRDVEQPSP